MEREKAAVVPSYISNFSPNHIWIQDFGRRPLYESVRWTKGDISHCSWLLALENSLIGLGGEGVKKAGGLLVTPRDGDAAS